MAKLKSTDVDESVTSGADTETKVNTGAKNNGNSTIPDDVPEGWVEEQTSFPPYWMPEENASFRGIPISVDAGRADDDNSFIRYIIRATADTYCYRGSGDKQEEVLVREGEFFTVSVYASMRLEKFYGYEVMMKTVGKEKLDSRREMWKFRCFVSKDTRKLLDDERAAIAKKLLGEMQAQRARQLTEKAPF